MYMCQEIILLDNDTGMNDELAFLKNHRISCLLTLTKIRHEIDNACKGF